MSIPAKMSDIPDSEEIIAAKSNAAQRAFRLVEILHINELKIGAGNSSAKRKRFYKHRHDNPTTNHLLLTAEYSSSAQSSSGEDESSESSESSWSFNDDVILIENPSAIISNTTLAPPPPPTTQTVSLPLRFCKYFLSSLVHCLPLSIGFRPDSNGSRCFCPLSPLLDSWRFKHGLSKHVSTCNMECGKDSVALVQHVRDLAKGGCPFHDLVRLYLEEYFCYERGQPGYMDSRYAHKSMYAVHSPPYLIAVKFETEHNCLVANGFTGLSKKNSPSIVAHAIEEPANNCPSNVAHAIKEPAWNKDEFNPRTEATSPTVTAARIGPSSLLKNTPKNPIDLVGDPMLI